MNCRIFSQFSRKTIQSQNGISKIFRAHVRCFMVGLGKFAVGWFSHLIKMDYARLNSPFLNNLPWTIQQCIKWAHSGDRCAKFSPDTPAWADQRAGNVVPLYLSLNTSAIRSRALLWVSVVECWSKFTFILWKLTRTSADPEPFSGCNYSQCQMSF